jgi:hypothetical protein
VRVRTWLICSDLDRFIGALGEREMQHVVQLTDQVDADHGDASAASLFHEHCLLDGLLVELV